MDRFNKLLAERLLPIGLVVKIYVAALGAWWCWRMFKFPKSKSTTIPPEELKERAVAREREYTIFKHVMELHYGLLKLASTQIVPGPATDLLTLAERITAVLRRILQSLRVAGKWMLGNLDYIDKLAEPTKTATGLTETLKNFWTTYESFLDVLFEVFPPSQYDTVNVDLEEDTEYNGFSPFKGLIQPIDNTIPLNQVHPNDEFVLRISDILADGATLCNAKVFPFVPLPRLILTSSRF